MDAGLRQAAVAARGESRHTPRLVSPPLASSAKLGVHQVHLRFAASPATAIPARGGAPTSATDCELECLDFSATVDDYIIDPAGARQTLRVRRTTNTVPRTTDERQSVEPEVVEKTLSVRITVDAAGVELSGGGCDETIPIVAPKP